MLRSRDAQPRWCDLATPLTFPFCPSNSTSISTSCSRPRCSATALSSNWYAARLADGGCGDWTAYLRSADETVVASMAAERRPERQQGRPRDGCRRALREAGASCNLLRFYSDWTARSRKSAADGLLTRRRSPTRRRSCDLSSASSGGSERGSLQNCQIEVPPTNLYDQLSLYNIRCLRAALVFVDISASERKLNGKSRSNFLSSRTLALSIWSVVHFLYQQLDANWLRRVNIDNLVRRCHVDERRGKLLLPLLLINSLLDTTAAAAVVVQGQACLLVPLNNVSADGGGDKRRTLTTKDGRHRSGGQEKVQKESAKNVARAGYLVPTRRAQALVTTRTPLVCRCCRRLCSPRFLPPPPPTPAETGGRTSPRGTPPGSASSGRGRRRRPPRAGSGTGSAAPGRGQGGRTPTRSTSVRCPLLQGLHRLTKKQHPPSPPRTFSSRQRLSIWWSGSTRLSPCTGMSSSAQ